jgi:hypothetical protein
VRTLTLAFLSDRFFLPLWLLKMFESGNHRGGAIELSAFDHPSRPLFLTSARFP